MTFAAWRDGEVAVLGLGRSGAAAVRLLRSHGIRVYASDAGEGEVLERDAAALRKLGADVDVGSHDLERIRRAVQVIVSPGIAPGAEPLEAARDAGVGLSSEIDLGAEALPGLKSIVVTGTNGKTTTTALVAHLLAAGGIRATAAGNIGLAISAVALEPGAYDWLALEMSSFQLHDTSRLIPAVGVMTNLSPDHLDRYGALEEYYADKRRLFANAGPESIWVLNVDDTEVMGMGFDVSGTTRTFSTGQRADAWLDRDQAALMLDGRV
ncbi:MAG: Mur ligase family protein, partial [Gemmatimonadales bacterium]